MSEKPQEVREDDILEQIITQGLEKISAPLRTADAGEHSADESPSAPKREDSGVAPSPTDRKNRRSAVYLYLLILFGAAFLMLLLAYFVQQRSSEDTISDLRDSMNLSRTQLLEQISALEELNAELEEQNNRLSQRYNYYKDKSEHWQEKYEERAQQTDWLWEENSTYQEKLNGWEDYWLLEQSYQAGEYEDCIAILLLANMREFGSYTPNQEIADRREEIIQALIDLGLLPEDRNIRVSDYQELINRYLAEHPDYDSTGWGVDTSD